MSVTNLAMVGAFSEYFYICLYFRVMCIHILCLRIALYFKYLNLNLFLAPNILYCSV